MQDFDGLGPIADSNSINNELCYSWDLAVAPEPTPSPPEIDGFTYRGMGCSNSAGNRYDYVSVSGGSTVEDCAQACQEYSSDQTLVGITVHPNLYGSQNCNCMLADGNGGITDTDSVGCPEEVCYSYNGVTFFLKLNTCFGITD